IETAVTVLSSLVGGLLVKIGAKYALKWKAAAKLFSKVKKLVTDIADVIKGWGKAADDLSDAKKALNLPRANMKLGDNAAGAACSFTGSTKVLLANGITKPISKIKPGDRVYASDPRTGEKGARAVTATWVHVDTVVDLEIAGKTITTTEDHPFWNATDHQWQRADQLNPGDKVLTATGKLLPVDGIDLRTTRTDFAYNLTITDIHTYYVLAGNAPVLVHNTGPCQPDLDALSQSGQAAAKGGRTAAGRAYQKHMDRGELDRVPGVDLDRAGQHLLDDILTNPATTRVPVTSGGFKGGSRFIMPGAPGQKGFGATFDSAGIFQYFGRY
ncbi:MAG: polymorphic toxin-type HINT domain-containing protein, partial [Acidobacteriota bacterium]